MEKSTLEIYFFFLFYKLDLDRALSCLAREDPSLRVSYDSESGQVLH